MLPLNHPDHIRIAFDDRYQAPVNAGLLFPATQDLKHGVGLNHLPSGRFAANGAWLAVQVMAHNLVLALRSTLLSRGWPAGGFREALEDLGAGVY